MANLSIRILQVLFASVMAILLMSCPVNGSEGSTPGEYAIYSSLIEHFRLETPLLVITAETNIDDDKELVRDDVLKHLRVEFPSMSVDTIADFKSKNGRPWRLERKLSVSSSYVLVLREELDKFWNNCGTQQRCGWDLFYDKYPDSPGIVTFSRAGFNPKGDEALAYLGNQRNWKAGTGYLVLLRKRGGQWQVIKSIVVWMS